MMMKKKKKPTAKKKKKATLRSVARKAMADPEFFRKLRTEARPALLQESGLTLDAEDSRRLAAILDLDGKTLDVDLGKLMERVRGGSSKGLGGLSWIAMWSKDIVDPSVR